MLRLRRSLLTLAAIPFLLLPLACAGEAPDPSEPAPVARTSAAPMTAIRIELTLPADHSGPDDVAALVELLEGQADVAQAKAMVHESSDDAGAAVVVELWGQDLPGEDELAWGGGGSRGGSTGAAAVWVVSRSLGPVRSRVAR